MDTSAAYTAVATDHVRLQSRIAELEAELELAVAAAMGCRVLLDRPVTEDDIQAAIAEARLLRPQIDAEMAIRDALDAMLMAHDLPGDHCEMDQAVARSCMTCRYRDLSGEAPDDAAPVVCRAVRRDNFPLRIWGVGSPSVTFAREFVCRLWAVDRRKATK